MVVSRMAVGPVGTTGVWALLLVLGASGSWSAAEAGGGEAEGGDGDLVWPEEEEGAEGCTAAGGGFGEDLRGDAVDDSHEGAEGVVDSLASGLLLFLGEGLADGFGQLAGDDLGGVFVLR